MQISSQPDQPWFDLSDCILAARNAAESARKLAVENPSDAARHEARSDWYLERVRQWTEEMERAE